MAELTLAIFGLAIPLAQGLFRLHGKLEEIASAPSDIELFKNETYILGTSVNAFQMQCPVSLERLTESKKKKALVHAQALVDHFDIMMKSTETAVKEILSTFDDNLGAIGQLLARVKWILKKPAIAAARNSMILFYAMINMFVNYVFVEALLHENGILREKSIVSSEELTEKLYVLIVLEEAQHHLQARC